MINVQLCVGTISREICNIHTPVSVKEIWEHLETTGVKRNSFYITHNGRLVNETDTLLEGYATIVPKLLGGKGGFGSMLRAIGAQIEKTTNREACRDLSGRRLRDINEEKRLKSWIEKQTKREEEAVERKKRKLQSLCNQPKHEFKDQSYEHERSILTERVGNAVEEGFKAVTGASSGIKRKCTEDFKSNKKTMLDLDIDSDELDTSDNSDDDEETQSTKIAKSEERVSNDSGHSSDETEKINNNSDSVKDNSVESFVQQSNNESSSSVDKVQCNVTNTEEINSSQSIKLNQCAD